MYWQLLGLGLVMDFMGSGLARKLGMTFKFLMRIEAFVPVTVIEAGPAGVVQVKKGSRA